MRRIVLAALLSSCGALDLEPTEEPGASTRCAGNVPEVCDGRCSWRCVDGRWQAPRPCEPCACFAGACFSLVP
jgi:hypothetical protein